MARQKPVVVGTPGDEIAAGRRHGHIPISYAARIHSLLDYPYTPVSSRPLVERQPCAVGRSVVRHHDLIRRIGLRERRHDCLAHHSGAIIGGDRYRDLHVWSQFSAETAVTTERDRK